MTQQHVLENLTKILSELSDTNANLLAATKTVPVDIINLVTAHGVKFIGENRVQELLEKYPLLERRNEIEVHMIGRLQTNKVKYIIDKVDLIHSVDSVRLLEEIQKQAQKIDKIQDILVQVNIGDEQSKGGVAPEDTINFVNLAYSFPNIRWRGLMCIPPSNQSAEKFFIQMQKMLVDITAQKLDNINNYILSMGMSNDYLMAAQHGATLVRVGSALFGHRQY